MIKRAIILSVAAVLALGIAAPYINADRYGEQIRAALERGLNRKVEIGPRVRFNLFTGPGFTIERVVIYDDPSFGYEPIAFMQELEARVNISSLWTRQLSFSMIRLVEPSLNVARREAGPWNIVSLLQNANTASSALPEVQIEDGRISFKFGDLKSPYFISSANVTVSPRRDSLYVKFEGEPARTDRSARTTGLVTVRGNVSTTYADLDLELEKSPVDELGGLLRGRRLEYHGTVASRAKLRGPLNQLDISGFFNLSDVHRWDLMTEHNRAWSVNYKGVADLSTERVELATTNSANTLKLLATNVLKRPEWAVDMAINELAASTLVSLARDMGAPVPKGVAVEGRVTGMLGIASNTGLQGQLRVTEGQVQLQDGPQLKLADAALLITGDTVRLAPAALTGEQGQGAQLEAEYDAATRVLDATISGQGLRLLSRAAVPLVNRFQGGIWSAALKYHEDEEKRLWTGGFDVRDTTTRVPGLTQPVRIATARIDIDGEELTVRRMRAQVGDIEIYGSYGYDLSKARPHRFDLTVPKVDLSEVESLLAPVLRRNEGFLARTLRFRRTALPDWLEHRKAEGILRIGTLTAGDSTARAVRSRIVWEGGTLQFATLEGKLEEGSFKGFGSLDVTKSEPRYRLVGRAQNLPWKGGKVDLDGHLETSGTGLGLLINMRGEGKFLARSVVLAPDQVIRSASGEFSMAITRGGPQFKLSEIQASLGAERFTGDAATQADGRMLIELASANRTVRMNFDIAR